MSEEYDIRDNAMRPDGPEKDIEKALRPLSFSDFTGQEKIIDNLSVFVKAARMRGGARPHSAARASGLG